MALHRKTFNIPTNVYVASQESAHLLDITMTGYLRGSLKLLSYAAINHFNPTGTRLVTGDGEFPIPHLVIPQTRGLESVHLLHLNLTERENESLQAFAQHEGVSATEQVRRALEFRNSVIAHCLNKPPTFIHERGIPVVCLI